MVSILRRHVVRRRPAGAFATPAQNKVYATGIVVDGIDANCIGQTNHWAIEECPASHCTTATS